MTSALSSPSGVLSRYRDGAVQPSLAMGDFFFGCVDCVDPFADDDQKKSDYNRKDDPVLFEVVHGAT
jgi:hypothetical protein